MEEECQEKKRKEENQRGRRGVKEGVMKGQEKRGQGVKDKRDGSRTTRRG